MRTLTRLLPPRPIPPLIILTRFFATGPEHIELHDHTLAPRCLDWARRACAWWRSRDHVDIELLGFAVGNVNDGTAWTWTLFEREEDIGLEPIGSVAKRLQHRLVVKEETRQLNRAIRAVQK